jgi:hypothetical protein
LEFFESIGQIYHKIFRIEKMIFDHIFAGSRFFQDGSQVALVRHIEGISGVDIQVIFADLLTYQAP